MTDSTPHEGEMQAASRLRAKPVGSFIHRLRRLYRYFRGQIAGTIYAQPGFPGYGRRKSFVFAWQYARKGGGDAV